MGFFETIVSFFAMNEFDKEAEREHQRQELVSDLLRNAAIYGVEYSDEEIEEFLADSERLGLLD